jgi:DNA-directed RNA polymerase subunit RPC12/RpoP
MGEVKLIPAVCPSCGASLNLPADVDRAHCLYCGTQILVSEAKPDKVECKVCDGFGRIDLCVACRGSGTCTWFASSSTHGHNDITSYLAYGTESHCAGGSCSACEGSGSGSSFSSCPFCGGTGKCPRCLGNAKCIACHGVGVIPGPVGSSTCPGCGGKGHLHGEPPKMPDLSKCPECGTPMTSEMFFCPRCVFVKGCPHCKTAWPKASLLCPWCGFKKGARS